MRRLFRLLLWLPFWLITRPLIIGCVIIGVAILKPASLIITVVACGIVGGLCKPIEARLRPMSRPKSRLPSRAKPTSWARAEIAVQNMGSAASLSAIVRELPPELRQVLAAPVNRQPEAVAHDLRILHHGTAS